MREREKLDGLHVCMFDGREDKGGYVASRGEPHAVGLRRIWGVEGIFRSAD